MTGGDLEPSTGADAPGEIILRVWTVEGLARYGFDRRKPNVSYRCCHKQISGTSVLH